MTTISKKEGDKKLTQSARAMKSLNSARKRR
jgi:hypothetical protein